MNIMYPAVSPLSDEELEATLHRHLSIESTYPSNHPLVGRAFSPLVHPYLSNGPTNGDRDYLARILRVWSPQVDGDYLIGEALFKAISLGDTVAVQLLIDAGVDLAISQSYDPNFPPLLAASHHGHLAMVQMLWEKIGPEGRFNSERQQVSCLETAAANGHPLILSFFLDAWNGWTTKEKNAALVCAAGVRWDDCVAVLLARLTYEHEALQNALEWAVCKFMILPEDPVDSMRQKKLGNPTADELKAGDRDRQYRVACQLLDAGASPDASGRFLKQPMLFEAMAFPNSTGGLKALLEKGANPNIRHMGSTVLGAFTGSEPRSWYPERCEHLRILLEAGASPDMEDKSGETPLRNTAANGNLELFQLCISRSKAKDPTQAVNPQGESLLHKAAARGREDIVEFLVIKCLLDVNLASHNGWTPLLCALSPSASKREETAYRMATFLLKHGANVQIVTNEGWSPLHALASWSRHDFTMKAPAWRRRDMGERGPLLRIARELIRRGAPLDTQAKVLQCYDISSDRLQDIWGSHMQKLAEDVVRNPTGETEESAVTGISDTTPVAWAIRTDAMDLIQVFFSSLSPGERNESKDKTQAHDVEGEKGS